MADDGSYLQRRRAAKGEAFALPSTTMSIEVPAKLMLVPEQGAAREATDADLKALGWHHRDDVYDRIKQLFDAAGLPTDEGNAGTIRSIIEWCGYYDYPLAEEDALALREIARAADAARSND